MKNIGTALEVELEVGVMLFTAVVDLFPEIIASYITVLPGSFTWSLLRPK